MMSDPLKSDEATGDHEIAVPKLPEFHHNNAASHIHTAASSPNVVTDSSTMFLANISEHYGSTMPKTACPDVRVEPLSTKLGQLPMFLSKTYHMIDKTSSDIASWSESGDSFVIKDPEKFASHILPKYFKHSNFSSFSRQLNFYGFRKLKGEPILTADYDSTKASYVSFFHENFQRGKPDLLHDIRRATRSEQSSKDDMDVLRDEITSLREQLTNTTQYYNRRLTEISADTDRRFNQLRSELRPLLGTHTIPPPVVLGHPIDAFATMTTHPTSGNVPTTTPRYTMKSLTHVAGVKLQSPSVKSQNDPSHQPMPMSLVNTEKRPVPDHGESALAKRNKLEDRTVADGTGDGHCGGQGELFYSCGMPMY